jgi:hypothetical protein
MMAEPMPAKPMRVEPAPARVAPPVQVAPQPAPVRVAPQPAPVPMPVPVQAAPVPARGAAAPAWIEPVLVEPAPVAPMRVEPVFLEPEPATLEDDEPLADLAALDSMSSFGAGILQARRGPNKFFIFAALLAALAIGALIFMR